ncbi:MAG: hypothetical protein OXJ62_11905 [Spirochaetaceae bacterium]|nr:hypothetical protein [Spirochaetaceae bacterium]
MLCRVEAVNTTGRFLDVRLAAALEPANFAGRATRVERELMLPPGPSELELWIDVVEPAHSHPVPAHSPPDSAHGGILSDLDTGAGAG